MNKFEVYNKIYNFYRMFETWKLKNHEYYQYCCKKVKKHNHILHILTNGPSLNDTINYIDEVGGDVMMMNQMYLTPYYTKYRPKYMCFWDDDVYLNNEQLEEEVKNLNSNDDDMIIIFTEHMFKKYHTKYPKLNMKWIYTGGATRPYCKMKDKKKYEENYSSPATYTVALAALYAGIQMGYEKIYLHGNDFSFICNYSVDENNQVYMTNQHAYESEAKKVPMNITMKEAMEAAYYSMVGYDNIAKYAEDEGVKIYNLSIHSYIDVFEKLRMDIKEK